MSGWTTTESSSRRTRCNSNRHCPIHPLLWTWLHSDQTTELAGRFADGWVPQLLTVDALQDRLGDLRRGTTLDNRSADDLQVIPHLRACATEDGAVAREYARQHVAFMVARYGPFYRVAIADAGWETVTEPVRERWSDGDKRGAAEAIPDTLLDDIVAATTPEEVRAQRLWFEDIDGVDGAQVGFIGPMNVAKRRETMSLLAQDG